MRETDRSVCPQDCPSQRALLVPVSASPSRTDIGGGPALHSNLVQVERRG